MLLSKFCSVKWNSKIKKHYVDLGYVYTKMGDSFDVKVEDLTSGSSCLVDIICDYCGEIYQTKWEVYLRCKKRNLINKDCCGNPECTGKKSHDTIKYKYNVDSVRDLDFVNEKIKNTNISRYGCENPFGNEDVKKKIKNYYNKNYGVSHNMQIPECVQKSKNTCMKKYGVESYTQTKEYRESFRGENSPVWKGDKVLNPRSERCLPEYRDWRKHVFDRDCYTCQCCGDRNGNGKYVRLEAHHIKNWKQYKESRHDVDNGITLCSKCHLLFHSIYGKKDNNEFQLHEFINKQNNIDKKIC